ncbi:venom metalloproteinase 3 [Nasonia vitripennis]|uniref:Peptidase M12B domain-containing protein n=1 Tax=Nasonia vitripennis TaxID=7425 RepID=A0A7M7INE1_NASVI|nr:venom metalloproteinase 3 [Nasonia vitripennis]XP_016837410.1 venom metalloproteinase 3 [Nasonia vitripennis]
MAYFDYRLILCLVGFVLQLSHCFELDNNEMTKEKARFIFRQQADSIPDYHTVHVDSHSKYRSKRDAGYSLHLVQFEIDKYKYSLKLNWRRRSVLELSTPILLITSVSNETRSYAYKIVEEDKKIIDGVFFEDLDNVATLLAYYDKKRRRILYDGIFGLGTETHVIRSVPEKWRTISKPTESFKRTNSKENNEHIVFRPSTHNKKARSSFLDVGYNTDEKDKLNEPVEKLHIKILPVLDYALFHLLGENVQETLKYVATFWNAVDMQFSQIDRSKIEITVTGVVIATDEDALTFINECRNKADPSKADAFQFLERARMYFYKNFINDTGITNYDAIFVMTGLDTKPTAGMSYIGRICNRLYSTAFVLDDANFLSLHSAVHELGHLMNFYHDGSDSAEDCNPYPENDVSTVMAPFISEAKSIVWSQCSKRSLEEFIQTKAAKCLREAHRIK